MIPPSPFGLRLYAAILAILSLSTPAASDDAFEQYEIWQRAIATHEAHLEWTCQQHTELDAELAQAKSDFSIVILNQSLIQTQVDSARTALAALSSEEETAASALARERIVAVEERSDRWKSRTKALTTQIREMQSKLEDLRNSKAEHKHEIEALKKIVEDLLNGEAEAGDGTELGPLLEDNSLELDEDLEEVADLLHDLDRDVAMLDREAQAWEAQLDLACEAEFADLCDLSSEDAPDAIPPGLISPEFAEVVLDLISAVSEISPSLPTDPKTPSITPGSYYDSGFGNIQLTALGGGFLGTYDATYDRGRTGTLSLYPEAETGTLRGTWSEPSVGRQGTLENVRIDDAGGISGEWTVTEAGHYSGRDLDARPGKFSMNLVGPAK